MPISSSRCAALFALSVLLGGAAFAQHPPGTRDASLTGATLSVHLSATPGRPELTVRDTAAARTILIPDLFTVTLRSGAQLRPSSLHWDSWFSPEAPASTLCAHLSDPVTGAKFRWCLLSHAERRYMQLRLTITAPDQDLPIAGIQLLHFPDPGIRTIGLVQGSPLADSHMYFAVEDPLAWSRVSDGQAQAGISRVLPLRAGQSVTESAVLGTYPPGQLRRTFLAYLEQVRARPYQPFLNYNTWYDIGYTNRFSEADVLDRIHAFGTELVRKRGVHMDSFVLDDGWDDPSSLWNFNSGFPHGLTRVVLAAAAWHAGIGIWMSPWGGYDRQKLERIAFGHAHGYEIMNGGYALSGPRYYRAFSQVAFNMVDRYHVNLFKFDGTGNADRVFPGSLFDSDFAAAIHLIAALRSKEPGIFINLTTGTYPSPFWLLYADSIWRGGDDHSFAGVGSKRQQWITYRDAQTYRNIVQRGPLFPLNSLMLHGIVYAQKADGLSTDPGHDFRDEVLTYFGSGTQLQEMYVTPSLLSPSDWDILARAARWSRANAAILKDSHWIGGDPAQLQVYGWAAWNPRGWIVTLRNPSGRPQTFTLRLAEALQIPPGAATSFMVRQPFASAPLASEPWQAATSVSVPLAPFEVRIYQGDRSP